MSIYCGNHFPFIILFNLMVQTLRCPNCIIFFWADIQQKGSILFQTLITHQKASFDTHLSKQVASAIITSMNKFKHDTNVLAEVRFENVASFSTIFPITLILDLAIKDSLSVLCLSSDSRSPFISLL